jgi:hypothetical protein
MNHACQKNKKMNHALVEIWIDNTRHWNETKLDVSFSKVYKETTDVLGLMCRNYHGNIWAQGH